MPENRVNEPDAVLESVRRLVNGELKPRRSATVAEPAGERLLLTPSLRVETAPDAAEADGSDALPDEDDMAPARALEDRIAELEAAVGGQSEQWEPDGSELIDEETPREFVFGAHRNATPAPVVAPTPEPDDAPLPEPEAVTEAEPQGFAEDPADYTPFVDEPVEFPAESDVVEQPESLAEPEIAIPPAPPTPRLAEPFAKFDPNTVPMFEPPEDERPRAANGPLVDEEDLEERLDREIAAMLAGESDGPNAPRLADENAFDALPEAAPEVDLVPQPDLAPVPPAFLPDLDAGAAPEPEEDLPVPVEDDPLPEILEFAAPDDDLEPEAPEPVEADAEHAASVEDFEIDEDALRDLVAEIVRGELQGELGVRITRNVRKLVRREIHRALMTRDFG